MIPTHFGLLTKKKSNDDNNGKDSIQKYVTHLFFKDLFVYICLCWVFIAGCGLWQRSEASLVVERGLWKLGFSNCGTQA